MLVTGGRDHAVKCNHDIQIIILHQGQFLVIEAVLIIRGFAWLTCVQFVKVLLRVFHEAEHHVIFLLHQIHPQCFRARLGCLEPTLDKPGQLPGSLLFELFDDFGQDRVSHLETKSTEITRLLCNV